MPDSRESLKEKNSRKARLRRCFSVHDGIKEYRPKSTRIKIMAVLEIFVLFSLTLFLIAVLALSPAAEWQRSLTHRPFLEYSLMIVLPLLFLIILRRNWADYGLSLRNLKYHIDIAMTGLLPVAIASIPFAFLDYRQWNGAFVLTAVRIGLIFTLALMLRDKPASGQNGAAAGFGVIWIASGWTPIAAAGNALSALLFSVFFLALGEELLFRGYIQSRMNAVFGRPFRFFGVRWGWGVLIASVLFGLMHVLNIGSIRTGTWQITWAWGFWTFFSGLVFGFLREKTGGIIVPTLLHGLPVAIANMFLGL